MMNDIMTYNSKTVLNIYFSSATCKNDEFSCPVGGEIKCLHTKVRCDGNQDCSNGEDEAECKGSTSRLYRVNIKL